MKEKKCYVNAFGINEYGEVDFPRKMSNVKVSRIEWGEINGCSWCFPHGFETYNSTISKNRKSWKFYRKNQFRIKTE